MTPGKRPTFKQVSKLIQYDPETGALAWICRKAGRKVYRKDAAYPVTGKDYLRIKINRKHYKAHVVAWLLVKGRWPTKEIDHVNGKGKDNRWENLRAATRSQNKWNMKIHKRNKSGYKGVSQNGKKWMAKIHWQGKVRYLGCFNTPEIAHFAYMEAANRYFGEFARAK